MSQTREKRDNNIIISLATRNRHAMWCSAGLHLHWQPGYREPNSWLEKLRFGSNHFVILVPGKWFVGAFSRCFTAKNRSDRSCRLKLFRDSVHSKIPSLLFQHVFFSQMLRDMDSYCLCRFYFGTGLIHCGTAAIVGVQDVVQ